MKKSAFNFASWTTLLGFLISWGVWNLLEVTAFKWGWISFGDGFIITSIFTLTSFGRVYFTNLWQLSYMNNPDGKVRRWVDTAHYYLYMSAYRFSIITKYIG